MPTHSEPTTSTFVDYVSHRSNESGEPTDGHTWFASMVAQLLKPTAPGAVTHQASLRFGKAAADYNARVIAALEISSAGVSDKRRTHKALV